MKVDIPDAFKNELAEFVRRIYLRTGVLSQQRKNMFQSSFEEAYTKKCKYIYLLIIPITTQDR